MEWNVEELVLNTGMELSRLVLNSETDDFKKFRILSRRIGGVVINSVWNDNLSSVLNFGMNVQMIKID